MKIRLNYFYRKPSKSYHSIEKLFMVISENLPDWVDYKNVNLPFFSKGIFRRIVNTLWVVLRLNKVNHITGDIHYIALLMPRKRTILTIHDIEILRRNTGLKRRLLKWIWFSIPAARVRYITVISEFTRQELTNVIPRQHHKIHVIPNCIAEQYTYQPPINTKPRPVIFHLGTKKNKNLERLIEAVSTIDCKLVIAGNLTSKQSALLAEFKVDYENLVYMEMETILQQYTRADLVAFVSLYEGFGLPILEAQAVGRPVITSNVASMPHVAGNAALLVNPESVSEIRAGIIRLLDDKAFADELVQKGLQNVKRFRAGAVAAQYAGLYKKIVESS